MSNYGFVTPGSSPAQIAANARGVRTQVVRAETPGPWIYVLTGDPELDNGDSPEWENDFYYLFPIAFRHGLDGQTDMIGTYDLTLGAVSGNIAFMMQNRFAFNAPILSHFAVLLDDPGAIEDRVFGMAVQVIDQDDPDATATHVPVRIYWPLWGLAL